MHTRLCGAGHNLRMVLAHLPGLYFPQLGLAFAVIAMADVGSPWRLILRS